MENFIMSKLFSFAIMSVLVILIGVFFGPRQAQLVLIWCSAAWIFLFHSETLLQDRAITAPLLVLFFFANCAWISARVNDMSVYDKLDDVVHFCVNDSSPACEKVLSIVDAKSSEHLDPAFDGLSNRAR